MGAFPRRLITISFVVIALPIVVVASPLLVLGSIVVDLVTGRRRFPTLRLGLFAAVYLVHEWIGLTWAAAIGVRSGFGRRDAQPSLRRLQGWFLGSLLAWAGRLLGLQLALPDPTTLPAGDTIVLSRHSSMVDAVLPAVLYIQLLDRPVHYVLKKELEWDPCFDIVGHALGNHFVDRAGDTTQELAHISAMAAAAQPGAALVIFPEGTYATASNRERVRASLERRGETALIELADDLDVLLPPKPAGTLALMHERPGSPIVIFGHTGLEGLAQVSGLRNNLPSDDEIVVEWWVIPASALPTDDEAKADWLYDQWRKLDRWVVETNERPPR